MLRPYRSCSRGGSRANFVCFNVNFPPPAMALTLYCLLLITPYEIRFTHHASRSTFHSLNSLLFSYIVLLYTHSSRTNRRTRHIHKPEVGETRKLFYLAFEHQPPNQQNHINETYCHSILLGRMVSHPLPSSFGGLRCPIRFPS